jgi:hypothetical protein
MKAARETKSLEVMIKIKKETTTQFFSHRLFTRPETRQNPRKTRRNTPAEALILQKTQKN